ncbi:MAG: tRNA pseudouridine(38-40) synthase TruA [Methanobacterium paludis]|nr:tRNA pseudouridine(38-40) synthase TruA [Methanobacterium paludis]
MRNIKLLIEYDGTNYAGWQMQKNALSIQEVLEKAIGSLVGHGVKLIGASRTDAGVHARGMVANFLTDSGIPDKNFSPAINVRLPDDIRILNAKDVSLEFHSRYCSTGKRYSYKIFNRRISSPLYRNYTAHVLTPLDAEKMKAAAGFIIGTHDFSCFRSSGSSVKTSVRTVKSLEIERLGDILNIEISADGFLYNMVRIIAGTLIDAGVGKIEPAQLTDIIESRQRDRAGKTAPASGLCLEEVYY